MSATLQKQVDRIKAGSLSPASHRRVLIRIGNIGAKSSQRIHKRYKTPSKIHLIVQEIRSLTVGQCTVRQPKS